MLCRQTPSVDTGAPIISPLSTIQYTPAPTSVTNTNPTNPLMAGGLGSLLVSPQSCRVKSSASGTGVNLAITASSISTDKKNHSFRIPKWDLQIENRKYLILQFKKSLDKLLPIDLLVLVGWHVASSLVRRSHDRDRIAAGPTDERRRGVQLVSSVVLRRRIRVRLLARR